MPSIKQLSKSINKNNAKVVVNWFPGHMFSGMQAMIGKLNTVDCIIEIHDARIPFTGRNNEFRKQLGQIKPRLLILNKSDLADLSKWDQVKRRLADAGDEQVLLTDLSGTEFSFKNRNYDKILEKVLYLINESDRFNRSSMTHFNLMIVGIPNVGKSTLINRLRQQHLGRSGNPAKAGATAGLTKHVDNKIKICSRPLIYTLDTPGILSPSSSKSRVQAMQLGLCSTITDKVLDPKDLVEYLLKYMNDQENYSYQEHLGLDRPVTSVQDLFRKVKESEFYNEAAINGEDEVRKLPDIDKICWDLIKSFRRGMLGKVMFDHGK